VRRTAVLLDALARGGLVWLLVIGIRNVTETCPPQDFCDDPGLGTVLVLPFIVYILWNVGVIAAGLFTVLPSKGVRETGILAVVAIPRLLFLVALTVSGKVSWPFFVLLALTVASQGLALVAFRRGEERVVQVDS
jgi:hypothetical protein